MDLESTLKQFFQEKDNIELAILFGSYARGHATETSDVDIAVQLSLPLDAQTKYALMIELMELTHKNIDLIDLHTIGQPLLSQILKHPVRLKGDDCTFAKLTIKNVNTVQDFMPYIERMQNERRDRFLNG